MDAKSKAAVALTAVLALGVGGGVTYMATNQPADTLQVRNVGSETASQPEARPSQEVSESPSPKASQPAEQQSVQEQPAQEPVEQPAAQAPVVDSAPAPEPKDEPVTQPQQPKAENNTGIPGSTVKGNVVFDSEGRPIAPAHPSEVEKRELPPPPVSPYQEQNR